VKRRRRTQLRGLRRAGCVPVALPEKRYHPEVSLAVHLTFALRHGPLALLPLKRLFNAVSVAEMAEFVASQPTGAWSRRSWFLFE
jgi:hypothetical protein